MTNPPILTSLTASGLRDNSIERLKDGVAKLPHFGNIRVTFRAVAARNDSLQTGCLGQHPRDVVISLYRRHMLTISASESMVSVAPPLTTLSTIDLSLRFADKIQRPKSAMSSPPMQRTCAPSAAAIQPTPSQTSACSRSTLAQTVKLTRADVDSKDFALRRGALVFCACERMSIVGL